MKKSVLIGFCAIIVSIFTSLLFTKAAPGDNTATIQKTDNYLAKTTKGDNSNVLQFALTNNYTSEVFVETINLFGEMDQSTTVDVTLTGSGFSFAGNNGTLLGSGSGNVLELTTVGVGTGFSLTPNETKYITASANIPSDTNLTEFQLKVSDIKLTTGARFIIDGGSALSLSNTLDSGNFQIFPSNFTIEEKFPVDNQELISIDTNISGKIAGSFDLTDLTLTPTITQGGISFPSSNYTVTLDTTTRKFKITPTTSFNLNQTININLNLTEDSLTVTGPNISFQANKTPKTSTYFDTEKEINEDFIIPINFDTQNFTLNSKTTLTPTTIIPGVNNGLQIEFTAGTLISQTASNATWGGEINAPEILSVPNASLFSSASGKASNTSFAPKKRFKVGSDNVSLTFNQNAVFTIPTSETGTQGIYYSQDGTNWTRHGVCQVTETGFCVFQSNHFTEFTIGTETTTTSSGGGSTSRQNHMRHGGYDPRNIAKQFNPQRYNPNQIILRTRSAKQRNKYIPCEIDEEAHMKNSLYNLKLSQGAPRMCREDFENFQELPYSSFER